MSRRRPFGPPRNITNQIQTHAAIGIALAIVVSAAAGCTETSSGETARRDPTGHTSVNNVAPVEKTPKTRRFRFIYGATVTGLKPGDTARVWLPLANGGDAQEIEDVRISVPGKYRRTHDRTHGNALVYFEAEADNAGAIPLSVEYLVKRREILAGSGEKVDPREAIKFLAPSRMVPVDGSITSSIFGHQKPSAENSHEAAAQIYRAVNERMKYRKPSGMPWGQGDARWACDSKFGNCTDFHSVFIAAARDLKIPAKFEIGFPIPRDKQAAAVGGYHCWAKFVHDGRWIAVDISEANKHPELTDYYFGNLTPDRVLFTTGRDLMLDPPQKAGPVNFLVYPYVEVDGKPHTKLTKKFRYAAVE